MITPREKQPQKINPNNLNQKVEHKKSHHHHYLTKNYLTCGGIFLLAVLSLVVLLLSLIAKLGLLNIPLLSDYFNFPKPDRVVIAQQYDLAMLKDKIKNDLLTEAKKSRPPYKIAISEQELTGVLKNSTSIVLPSDLELKKIQLLVDEQKLKLYIHINWYHYIRFLFSLDVKPVVKNNKLALEFDNIYLGAWQISSQQFRWLLSRIFPQGISDSWQIRLNDKIGIRKVSFKDRNLILIIDK